MFSFTKKSSGNKKTMNLVNMESTNIIQEQKVKSDINLIDFTFVNKSLPYENGVEEDQNLDDRTEEPKKGDIVVEEEKESPTEKESLVEKESPAEKGTPTEKETSNKSVKKVLRDKVSAGNALFTLRSVSSDIEYPTSNSILKTETTPELSEAFTSELYESCVLSFSVVEIENTILVGLKNASDKYYGVSFNKDKFSVVVNDKLKSDVETLPSDEEFDYEKGDIFKIVHLLNEVQLFKNEHKIYASARVGNNNDSYRAVFSLFDKEDEIGNIQFYYVHQNQFAFLRQGGPIILAESITNDLQVDEENSFYLLEGVSSNITGISKGKNGQTVIIINNSGAKQTFSNNDANSDECNRLYLGGNNDAVELAENSSIRFLYVSSIGKWVLN
jgi:hypothetical protein